MTQSGDRDRGTGGQVRAGDVAEQAEKPVRLAARVGLVAYGLVNLVLAGLIAQVALGERERADKKGALQEIAETGLRRDLVPPARLRHLVVVLGTVGWTALGIADAAAGVLLVGPAIRFDPTAPVGLDAGIRTLAQQPFGPVMLLLLAAGLAVFAVFCLLDARYRSE